MDQPASRFSRAAIVGACWAPFAFLASFAWFSLAQPVSQGSPPSGPGGLVPLVGIPLLWLGATAPFGTTLLGWIAVSQIRRSAGRLHGMWLAVFDGLLFPLLVLDALLIVLPVAAWKRMPWATPQYAELLLIAIIVLSVIAAGWLDWLIIRRVWRAVNGNNSTALQQTGSTDKPTRFPRKAIVTAAYVCMTLSFAVLFTKQWNERKREGVWVPARISNTITQQYGDAQVRVVDVSQEGQVVVVSFVCEMFRPNHELMVQYGGPALSYPNDLASSGNIKVKDLDCLIASRAKLVGDNIGKVLAGTNVLSDRTMFRIGFVLPDSQTAAQVVKAVQEVHLGKPCGLGKDKGVLLLFSLHRDFGKDAAGKPVVEALDASLWSRPKASAPKNKGADRSPNLSNLAHIETITIAADGTLTVTGEPCPHGQLAERLGKIANKNAVSVVVHADEKVACQQVQTILDTCKAAGINDVKLATP